MRTLRLSLTGVVTLALLSGLGGMVMAQEEAAPDPMAPGYFILLEDRGDSIVASDPRFSGALIEGEFDSIDFGDGENRSVYWGQVRIENEDGAWDGRTSGFTWGSDVPWNEQFWYVGEGAYEGLSAVAVGQCCVGDDMRMEGIIFEGEVPPQDPSAE